MDNNKGKQIVRQYAKLKSIRDPLDKEYQDCYDYTYPSLGVGFNQTEVDGITNAQNTRAKSAERLHSVGTDSVRLLASSVLSSLTPPSTRWFDLEPDDIDSGEIDQEGKEWLEESAERIHKMIHNSNFDTEALDFMTHEMIAGMAGLYLEYKRGKFYFETWPLHSLYCAEVLNEGRIDSVYRKLQFTAQEAVIEFGFDQLPERIQETYKNDQYDSKTFNFICCIRPRIKNGKQANGRIRTQLPWESIWVSDCGTVVREAGFEEMPTIVARWQKIPDTDYARGPVYDALPDLKTLNKLRELMLTNADLRVSGSYKVMDDGVINPKTIKFGARRIIPVGNMDNLQPLSHGGDIEFAINEISNLEASIRKILLADQLGPTEKAITTATEIQTRNNQVRQILGPIFARLQKEFLGPVVERCFGLAARAGLLSPIPESLAVPGKELRVSYRSPFARSQQMQDLTAIDEMIARFANLLQIQPEMADFIDFDELAVKYSELLGVDPSLIKDKRKVQIIRTQRKNAQEAQAAQEQQMMQAQMALQASKADPQATGTAV